MIKIKEVINYFLKINHQKGVIGSRAHLTKETKTEVKKKLKHKREHFLEN